MTKTIKTAPCVPSCGLHFSKCVLLVYYKDILEKIVSEWTCLAALFTVNSAGDFEEAILILPSRSQSTISSGQIKMKTIMHFNQDRSGRPLLHHASTPLPSHIWKGILYVYHNQLLLLLNCSKHITIQFYFTTNCSYYTGEEPVVNFWFSCFVFFFSWLGCHSHSTQPFVLFMLYGREKANTAISSKIF